MSEASKEAVDPMRFVRKFPDLCCARVIRKGESQPCDDAAVAVTTDRDGEQYWPVCARHTRGRRMVPLAELLEIRP